MGRMYAIVTGATNVGSGSAVDLLEISAAAAKPVYIHSVVVSTGDADEELVQMSVMRATGAGTGGSSATARALDPGDAAASFTATMNRGTLASGASEVHAERVNVRSRGDIRPTAMEVVGIAGGGIGTIRVGPTASATIQMFCTAYVEEVG